MPTKKKGNKAAKTVKKVVKADVRIINRKISTKMRAKAFSKAKAMVERQVSKTAAMIVDLSKAHVDDSALAEEMLPQIQRFEKHLRAALAA